MNFVEQDVHLTDLCDARLLGLLCWQHGQG